MHGGARVHQLLNCWGQVLQYDSAFGQGALPVKMSYGKT